MVAARTGIVDLDRSIYHHLIGTYGDFYFFGIRFTQVFTPYVDAAVLLVTGAVLSAVRRHWAPLLGAGWAFAICLVVVLDLKYAFARPSPGNVPVSAGGYPSGHTAAAMTMLGSAVLLVAPHGRARTVGLALVTAVSCLVASCMVYDRFHYLADVVASLLLSPILLFWVTRTPPYRICAAAGAARLTRRANGR